MQDRVHYLLCSLVEAGIVRAGEALRLAAKFLQSKLPRGGGSALSPGVRQTDAEPNFLGGQGEFRWRADALLRAPEASYVLSNVARAISNALTAEGHQAGQWAPESSKDQDDCLRIAQWAAPFQDPLSAGAFEATIRVHIGNFGALHTTRIWVDLCRSGERRNAPDSVSQAMAERNWRELSQAAAGEAFQQQLVEWVSPESVERITVRAHELVSDLTTILAP